MGFSDGNGISCMQTICTSLQIDNYTNTLPLNSYRPDALPDVQSTVAKHWRHSANCISRSNCWLTAVVVVCLYSDRRFTTTTTTTTAGSMADSQCSSSSSSISCLTSPTPSSSSASDPVSLSTLYSQLTKVCWYDWYSAGSLGWPFTMLKY